MTASPGHSQHAGVLISVQWFFLQISAKLIEKPEMTGGAVLPQQAWIPTHIVMRLYQVYFAIEAESVIN